MKLFSFLILSIIWLQSCEVNSDVSTFKILDSKSTGLNFSNDLVSTTEFNILSYLYFYNGGGVAIGDVNNDGLPDIYLCGNQVDDKLFINDGDFKFTDISHLLPENDIDGWSTGVTMVDINHDGFLDIYVCKLGLFKSLNDSNKLFINDKGVGFSEQASAYNLNFSGLCTQSAFLDYDRDGDLDCYLLNHSIKDPSQFKPSSIRMLTDSISGDKLLENQEGKFVDVTKESNIYSSNIGFGLGIDVSDVNNDGWLDIYVGNDFHEQDYLYINQGDKTFKESIELSTGHISNFSMGCSLVDLNNDLRTDVLTMDMKSPSYENYKKSGGWESMQIYNYKRSFGYHHQSPKNCMQFNLGNQNGIPQFSDQSGFYKTSSTDWSWAPLVYDFDNDGDKDVFITNGIKYRPNDLDFIKFHFSDSDSDNLSKLDLMPSGLVANRYFENELDEDRFSEFLIGEQNATTGAAVSDLNLDGKLDIVLNEVNGSVKILKNNTISENSYIQVTLNDYNGNINGIGAKLVLYQDGLIQSNEMKSSSGFQSCSDQFVHFGISKPGIDSLRIIWADGYEQMEYNLEAKRNKRVEIVKQANLIQHQSIEQKNVINTVPNFKVNMSQPQNQISEKWLLFDPECTYDLIFPIDSISCFVVNDDRHSINILNFQGKNISPLSISGLAENIKFLSAGLSRKDNYYLITQKASEKSDSIINFIVEIHTLSKTYQILETKRLNVDRDISNSKIIVQDFDNDLDMDIVIGGSYIKGQYGSGGNTVFYVNEGLTFKEIELLSDELVYDMQFANLDSDGVLELVVVGHWFPITIFDNLETSPSNTEVKNSSGLWFSIELNDFDRDGTIDLLAGNFGLNHDLNVDQDNPLRLYYNDFDKNGRYEALITIMEKEREVPYFGHETFIDQLPIVKRDFMKASDFANASIRDIIDREKLRQSNQKQITELRSSIYKLKDDNWVRGELTNDVHKFPVTKIVYNTDEVFVMGNLDVIDPNLGKQDAGRIMPLDINDVQIVNNRIEIPIERKVVWDAILIDSTLFYISENDSLRYFNFR